VSITVGDVQYAFWYMEVWPVGLSAMYSRIDRAGMATPPIFRPICSSPTVSERNFGQLAWGCPNEHNKLYSTIIVLTRVLSCTQSLASQFPSVPPRLVAGRLAAPLPPYDPSSRYPSCGAAMSKHFSTLFFFSRESSGRNKVIALLSGLPLCPSLGPPMRGFTGQTTSSHMDNARVSGLGCPAGAAADGARGGWVYARHHIGGSRQAL
jgi:hypothetical protein